MVTGFWVRKKLQNTLTRTSDQSVRRLHNVLKRFVLYTVVGKLAIHNWICVLGALANQTKIDATSRRLSMRTAEFSVQQ